MNKNIKSHAWDFTYVLIILILLGIALLFISSINLVKEDVLIQTDCENRPWVKMETTSPPRRAYHAMAYDAESDRVILFSGDSAPKAIQMYSDTWAYDHNSSQWTNLNPQNKPAKRAGHAMSYDAESDRIILFGSGPASIIYGNDTWAFDFNSNNWTKLNPPQKPPERFGHSMAYDAESDRIILFGGFPSDQRPIDDTWSYDFNTNTWTEMNPSTTPPARLYHSMAYDSESDRIILFGGGFAAGAGANYTIQYGDTWAYDFNSNTWSQMMPDTSPSPRVYTDMIYNEKCDRIILFGGGTQSFNEANPEQGHGNETWLYDFNTNTWQQVITDQAPSYRKKHKLAYDAESDCVILFGGDKWNDQGSTIAYQNETWVTMVPPYGQNVLVNKSYQTPGMDTLLVTSEIVNPENHDVEMKAIIASFDKSVIDTIQLYDDGLHYNNSAGDGLFGGLWPVEVGERNYNIHITTLSLNSGYYNILRNLALFTTIGPIVLADEPYIDGIFNEIFRKQYLQLTLQNNGKLTAGENIYAQLNTNDYRVKEWGSPTPFGNIEAGTVKTSSLTWFKYIEGYGPDSTKNNPIRFDVIIYSYGSHYWTSSFDYISTVVGIEDKGLAGIPKRFAISQNYPNPFNPTTTIEFYLPKTSNVILKIFNILGEDVAMLVSDRLNAGSYSYEWNASHLASGVYLYRLEAEGFVETKKMILMR